MSTKSIAGAGLLVAALVGSAVDGGEGDRFFITDRCLLAGSTGEQIAIRCDNSVTLFGWSFGVDFDESVLSVTDVTYEGTKSAGDDWIPDFFDGNVDETDGEVGWGCVLDIPPCTPGEPGCDIFDEEVIPAGSDQIIAFLIVDVLAASDVDTDMSFGDVTTNPDPDRPVKNVMTNDEGFSIIPALESGTVSVRTLHPGITEIQNNCGSPEDVFQVIGENFAPECGDTVIGGLMVEVGGAEALATLQGDGVTLDVTAPDLDVSGWVEVTVSTDQGSDSEAMGFQYERPAPVISAIPDGLGDVGTPGQTFTIEGQNLSEPLTVTVDGEVAAHQPPAGDGTSVVVTAPVRSEAGCVEVSVAVESLCGGDLSDSDPAGYCYELTGVEFKRGDSNNSGAVDLSDGVYTLNFLFLGGPEPPCKEAANVDDNGALEITDPINLLNHLFLGGPAPAPPGTACGIDPPESTSDLGCVTYEHCP